MKCFDSYLNLFRSNAGQFRLLHFRGKLIHVVDTASQNGASYATRSRLCARLRDKSLIIARASTNRCRSLRLRDRLFPPKLVATCALEEFIAGKTILLGKQNGQLECAVIEKCFVTLHLEFSTIASQGAIARIPEENSGIKLLKQ